MSVNVNAAIMKQEDSLCQEAIHFLREAGVLIVQVPHSVVQIRVLRHMAAGLRCHDAVCMPHAAVRVLGGSSSCMDSRRGPLGAVGGGWGWCGRE